MREAMFDVHQKANNLASTKKPSTQDKTPYNHHHDQILLLFENAKKGLEPNLIKGLNEFLATMNMYYKDDIFASKNPEKTYNRFLEIKAKRASRSSQSDA